MLGLPELHLHAEAGHREHAPHLCAGSQRRRARPLTHAPGVSVTIRRATAQDAGALSALEERAFPADRLSERSWKRHAGSAHARALVAETGGRIVAAGLILTRSDSRDARLYSIATDPEFRGRGLARRLLAALEEEALEAGCAGLRLEVREDNASALALYRSAGYERFARAADYYSDGMAALRLRRVLACAGEDR